MHSFIYIPLVLFAAASAAPLNESDASPSVKIQNGTVIGNSTGGIESFWRIPFAEPPTGTLRLKPPQSISSSFGTYSATATPPSCPQFLSQVHSSSLTGSALGALLDSPLVQKSLDESEDCLYMIVQRPAGTTSSDKLPVLFWIYGGGFETGWNGQYDGSGLINKSVALGAPMIYVSVNYRVGGFGFLAGSLLSAENSTNLGLRDQRKGLEWVAENVAAFGGDPSKVTIWGESAGAVSVFDHTVINGGDNTYNGQALFRGAIMDSGSVVPADEVTGPHAQQFFDAVALAGKCTGVDDVLACLRALPYKDYLRAVNSVPGIFSHRAGDLSYLPRPDPGDNFYSKSPELALKSGAFSKVPIINGDQEDEGTLFSLSLTNITTNDELIQYFATWFPSNPNAIADVTGLVANYPDEPELGQPYGSPFRTGSLNNLSPQFKRVAAIQGDYIFTLARRNYIKAITSQGVKAWSYLNTYVHGMPILGTFHGSDLFTAYGSVSFGGRHDTKTIQQYYISFVNHLDPNALGTAKPLIDWPQWDNSNGSSPPLVKFSALGLSLLPDTFRQNASDYLDAHQSVLRQ